MDQQEQVELEELVLEQVAQEQVAQEVEQEELDHRHYRRRHSFQVDLQMNARVFYGRRPIRPNHQTK